MEELKWLLSDGAWHAFSPGRTRSLCTAVPLPTDWLSGTEVYRSRCTACQRIVVQRLSAEQRAASPLTAQWRDIAARAALGDSWTYADTEGMPSWRETADRVAVALADAYRQGILQGNSERTGT